MTFITLSRKIQEISLVDCNIWSFLIRYRSSFLNAWHDQLSRQRNRRRFCHYCLRQFFCKISWSLWCEIGVLSVQIKMLLSELYCIFTMYFCYFVDSFWISWDIFISSYHICAHWLFQRIHISTIENCWIRMIICWQYDRRSVKIITSINILFMKGWMLWGWKQKGCHLKALPFDLLVWELWIMYRHI